MQQMGHCGHVAIGEGVDFSRARCRGLLQDRDGKIVGRKPDPEGLFDATNRGRIGSFGPSIWFGFQVTILASPSLQRPDHGSG